MDIDSVIKEAHIIAHDFGLKLRIIVVPEPTIIEVLLIKSFLSKKRFVFKNRRLYGCDSEGGKTHIHPIENPESHVFITKRLELRDFIITALHVLEERELL